MQTVQVIPKQIVVLTEFTLEELCLLRAGLEATELNLNSRNARDLEISNFMTKSLYPYVAKLTEELKDD